jgi:hypothetical protein
MISINISMLSLKNSGYEFLMRGINRELKEMSKLKGVREK